METLDALAQTFDHTASVIASVRPDQMCDATPCSELDVRALLTDTVGVVTNIGNGVRGDEMADLNAIALDDDVAAQFRTAAAQLVVDDDTRKFAGINPAVAVGHDATPTEALVAFLGRTP